MLEEDIYILGDYILVMLKDEDGLVEGEEECRVKKKYWGEEEIVR